MKRALKSVRCRLERQIWCQTGLQETCFPNLTLICVCGTYRDFWWSDVNIPWSLIRAGITGYSSIFCCRLNCCTSVRGTRTWIKSGGLDSSVNSSGFVFCPSHVCSVSRGHRAGVSTALHGIFWFHYLTINACTPSRVKARIRFIDIVAERYRFPADSDPVPEKSQPFAQSAEHGAQWCAGTARGLRWGWQG